jgi:8-oxo-dGTP diphosphatase
MDFHRWQDRTWGKSCRRGRPRNKEETGLRIRAGGIIGRRVHPQTGRTMVYMAARPTHGTDAFVGDPEELAEVRWVTPDQADELMDGTIYEPVRAHLRQMLGL